MLQRSVFIGENVHILDLAWAFDRIDLALVKSNKYLLGK